MGPLSFSLPWGHRLDTAIPRWPVITVVSGTLGPVPPLSLGDTYLLLALMWGYTEA